VAAARSTSKALSLEQTFRSDLERKVASQLAGYQWSYETLTLEYVVPARKAKYRPDFILGDKPPHILIEAKGVFGGYEFNGKKKMGNSAQARQKMLLVKEQHPELDIRFVFHNANKPIYKGSPTTHADWCQKNGFPYSDKGVVPQEWLDELAASRGPHPEAP
jgi:predicted nuclease of restriction endonuclease-like RecB superfamily